jgi:hypothetical protein
MLALGGACMKADGLTSLRSFTLTTRPRNSTDAWMDGTELLLRGSSSLEVFQVYVPNSGSMAALADNFFIRVIDKHRDHLVRFSFHRLCISLDIIDHVCASCPRLEELFVVIHHAKMVRPFVPSMHTFTRVLLGSPSTDTRPGDASPHRAHPNRRPTAAVPYLRACVGYRSPMQSNYLSGWN